jgi:hypothetical protein
LCSSTFERNTIVHRCAQHPCTFGGAKEGTDGYSIPLQDRLFRRHAGLPARPLG